MSDIVFTTQTTPATPGSGKADIFVDSSTKQVKSVNDAGVVAAYLTEAGHNVAAAVHGLPASVNVLGNRSAAGEFVQRGTLAQGTVQNGPLTIYYASQTLTFPVAFSSAPYVWGGGIIENAFAFAGVLNISTTACTLIKWSSDNVTAQTLKWVAMGA